MAFKESITKQNIIYPMPFKAEYFKIDDELVEKKLIPPNNLLLKKNSVDSTTFPSTDRTFHF